MKNTAVVGLVLNELDVLAGTKLIEQSGGNTGNILFTHGVCSQVYRPQIIGFQFSSKSELINTDYSSVVIPAANWIDTSSDWGFLADALEKIEVPICCVGLGAQIPISEIGGIRPGTLRFLELLARKCSVIGLRGEKTAEILRALGIENTVVCGCPSMYTELRSFHAPVLPEYGSATRLSMSFTRYTKDDSDDAAQRPVARLAAQAASSIILQSEIIEANWLANSSTEDATWLSHYYGISPDLIQSIYDRLHIFGSYKAWIDFHINNTDLTITSRIHGAIASYLAGKPAFLLTHDQRTSELGESMGIPSIPISDAQNPNKLLNAEYLNRIYDRDKFNVKHGENLTTLKKLYSQCNVLTIN
ncbi:polysaccharide pyruvyl transferase family protein [Pseudomonas sp. PS01301]|uniref:polysaccharide pyruvyl transferase family protein n=1 Tax=Pseudomonas sp. PS01301 TaxID=2991437 RepID=UPI00249A1BBD|nr:polysaccharide pyruvyl transferase family protein [Pseudomonas sp. PS01301]